jgi:hypothetical protein
MRPLRRLPAALAALIFLLQLPVVFSHQNYLLTWFNIDDGFYYFVVARNVAAGLGFTFDGLARTNGFHPLWLFIITPIFALPGKILPLRVLALLLVSLNAVTAALLYRLASRRLSPGAAFVTALAFALLPPIHNFTARGGMEAGLSAFLIILLLDRLAVTDGKATRGVLILAGVAALTVLARLDNVFLAGFAGGWLTLKGGRVPLRAWLRRALPYFVPLGMIILLYMTWNVIGFGTPTPVSGQVKRWWGTLPNSVYGFPPKQLSNYIGQFVTDDANIGPWALATAPLYAVAEGLAGEEVGARRIALAGLTAALALGLGWLIRRERVFMREAARDLGLFPLLLGCLVQIAYYKVGGSVASRPWYWVQEMVWLALAGGIWLDMIFRRMGNWKWVSGNYKLPITVLLAAFLIAPHFPRLGKIYSPEIAEGESYYLQRSAWMEANTKEGSLIGMTGSGSTAYFTDGRTIVNLDGLINSYEYFQHMQAGTAGEYLAEIGLDFVFGNDYIMTVSDPYGEIFAGRLSRKASFEDEGKTLTLWRFEP